MADVSGEAADLVVKEAMQVSEGAIKLAGVGLKNIAAFLIAIFIVSLPKIDLHRCRSILSLSILYIKSISI